MSCSFHEAAVLVVTDLTTLCSSRGERTPQAACALSRQAKAVPVFRHSSAPEQSEGRRWLAGVLAFRLPAPLIWRQPSPCRLCLSCCVIFHLRFWSMVLMRSTSHLQQKSFSASGRIQKPSPFQEHRPFTVFQMIKSLGEPRCWAWMHLSR